MLRATTFSLGLVMAIALPLGGVSLAHAQEPDVQITQLDCNSEPEVVVIQNLGDAEQDLIDWKLESDPPATETFDLLGVLQPGQSTSIALGQQSVFRDDDPTDYARIVDDTGATVHQVACGEVVAPTPTPSPTPSPQATPAADVPNGGGPPPVDDALSPVLLIVIGGPILVGGLAILALPALRAAPSPVAGHGAAHAPGGEATPRRPQGRRRGIRRRSTFSLASRLAFVETTLAVATALLSSLQRQRPE